jgi:glycosyltransferase involved in cell wall biosynthesis
LVVNSSIAAKIKMLIAEEEVSILIPTFNSSNFIERCLKSALSSNAGEIIISDDLSTDNTIEKLKGFTDKRLSYYINQKRLGLWENHFQLLKLSTKPWIKFLQADDYLELGGLKTFCNNDQENLSIISALSINEINETKEKVIIFNLPEKRRWNSKTYLRRLKIVGNELGTPSNTLIRRESIIAKYEFWISEVSSDLVMNIVAASKGDVVLLPPGPIIRSIHTEQDTNKQSLELFNMRLKNSVNLLLNLHSKEISEFAVIFCFIESIGALRMIVSATIHGQFSELFKSFMILKNLKNIDFYSLLNNIKYLIKMYKWKYGRRESFNLNFD